MIVYIGLGESYSPNPNCIGGIFMAHRSIMSRSKDRRVFRRTAVSSKKINIDPKVYRGGIRL